MLVIPRIAALVATLKTVEPLTFHLGQVATRFPNFVDIKRDDLSHLRVEDLEQADVVISVTVQNGEEDKFVLRGEWNAVEDFLQTHFTKENYNYYMEMYDRNQFLPRR